jgi:hypothetical protein
VSIDELTARYRQISKRVEDILSVEKYLSVYEELFTAGQNLSYSFIFILGKNW